MNYLAHLYLAEPTPEGLAGSLLGDFAKGSLERYPETVQRGIRLHRSIDAFTDAHPVVRGSRSRVSAYRRRFSGVMVDMFYDHFLARSWSEWSAVPLDCFAAQIYDVLDAQQAMFPERLVRLLPFMRTDNWLASYRDVESIRTAIDRMSRRVRRENALPGAADELVMHYVEFESDFRVFFPDLMRFATESQAT